MKKNEKRKWKIIGRKYEITLQKNYTHTKDKKCVERRSSRKKLEEISLKMTRIERSENESIKWKPK